MGPMNMSFHSSSPVLLLRPQQPSSLHFSSSMTPSTHSNFANTPSFSSSSPFQSCPKKSPKTVAAFPSTKPSRKRSRDEALSPTNAPEDASYFSRFPAPSSQKTQPTFADGINLLSPSGGDSNAANSQTFTWAKKKDLNDSAAGCATQTNIFSSAPRKAQRLDSTASRSDDAGNGAFVTSQNSHLGPKPGDPAIDDFTRLLGVGWTRLSDDDGVQAAARGWARYIENHFPVSNASIMLQSRGLGAYLVSTQQGFYLFHEELADGQLVASTWEQTLANLQKRPIAFEGTEVLKATRTPAFEAAMDGSAAASSHSTNIVGNSQPAVASCMDLD